MIKFTNPHVEQVAVTLCESHGGDAALKVIHGYGLLSNVDEKYQNMLKCQIEEHEKMAKVLKSVVAFNEIARVMGTDVEEVDE